MNKDQIKIKLQALPFFKGSLDLKFIEGFMTNDSYIATDDNNRYIVKIAGNKYYGVTRSHEIKASQAGYRAGISPKVIYYDDNFILEEYYGDSFDSNFKYKFHMQKCVSLLNGALWSMITEIFSKKVFDCVSYTNKMLKRYEKQFYYYSSLRI